MPVYVIRYIRSFASHRRMLTMVFRFVTEAPIVIKLELVKTITDLKLRNVCVCICVGSRQIRTRQRTQSYL